MPPGSANYAIAGAALALGIIVVGVTRWIEHHRAKNPMPRLIPTTPFMAFGILIVIVAIAFSFAVWRDTPSGTLDARAGKSNADLTADETAGFKTRLNNCWVTPAGLAGAQGVNVAIRIQLDSRGNLSDKPELIRAPMSMSGPALQESAMQALQQCQPYNDLPIAKRERWKVLDITFSPQGASEVSAAPTHKNLQLQ